MSGSQRGSHVVCCCRPSELRHSCVLSTLGGATGLVRAQGCGEGPVQPPHRARIHHTGVPLRVFPPALWCLFCTVRNRIGIPVFAGLEFVRVMKDARVRF